MWRYAGLFIHGSASFVPQQGSVVSVEELFMHYLLVAVTATTASPGAAATVLCVATVSYSNISSHVVKIIHALDFASFFIIAQMPVVL